MWGRELGLSRADYRSMDSGAGRFGGEVIDDADEAAGSHVGDVLGSPLFDVAHETVVEPTAALPTPEPAPITFPVFTYENPDLAQKAPEPTGTAWQPVPSAQPAPVDAHSALTPESVEASSPAPFVNPAAFNSPTSVKPTAVGVPMQTENLFAGETLAETPVVSGRRKPGTATRSRTADPDTSAAVTADALAHNKPRTVFDDPNITRETVTTNADTLPPLFGTSQRIGSPNTPSGRRTAESFSRIGRIGCGIIVGILIGVLAGGYVLAVFGPWQVTDTGIVARNLGYPVNSVPAGTVITMTRVGETKPIGIGVLFPIVLSTSKAEILAPLQDANGDIKGYSAKCLSGDCTPELTFNILIESILGKD